MTTETTPSPAPSQSGLSNAQQRIIYGALGAALLLGSVWFGPLTFGLLFAFIQAVMLWEFYRLMRAGGHAPATWWGVGAGILMYVTTFCSCFSNAMYIHGVKGKFASTKWASLFEQVQGITVLLAAVTLFLLTISLIIREMRIWPEQKQPFVNVSVALLGLLYVSFPMAMLNRLALVADYGYNYRRIFALLFLIWASDTGAYVAGKSFGKHKMAPAISPGKTWEGWAGGFVLTLGVGWALQWLLPQVPLAHLLVAAAVVAVFGPLGDLAESMLKRSVGVKDSGSILPGHGGLLDRFDAFLLVLPVLALLQLLAG